MSTTGTSPSPAQPRTGAWYANKRRLFAALGADKNTGRPARSYELLKAALAAFGLPKPSCGTDLYIWAITRIAATGADEAAIAAAIAADPATDPDGEAEAESLLSSIEPPPAPAEAAPPPAREWEPCPF